MLGSLAACNRFWHRIDSEGSLATSIARSDGKSLSYPRYENPCGWNGLLPPRQPEPPLSADAVADAVVVGAGYTGLAAAERWASLCPDANVVVIDAAEIGEGSPGRNSGFLLEITLANDADVNDLERLAECNGLIGATMRHLRDVVFDGGIDCAIEHAGTYRAAASPVGRAALVSYRRFLRAAGLPYETLSGDSLAQRIGTRYYSDALYSPHCYLVQPAALIRGLARLLPPNVTLHENTPALKIARDAGRWRVDTPQGALRSDCVLVANNAFAKDLSIARSRLATIYTYAALTKPLQEVDLDRTGTERSWGVLPAHRLGCTLRRTRDGRLLIRAQYAYEREDPNERVARDLLESLERRFPQLERLEIESCWGGATGFTRNGAPIWGEYRPGLYVSAGCNGGGVVKGTLFGGLLAERALGRDCPDVGRLFGRAAWMPPEPFRRWAFSLAALVERRRGAAEM